MKIRKAMGIIGVLFGTMLVMAGVVFTKTSLVNETFAAAAPGNKTNATNTLIPQAESTFLKHDVKTTTTILININSLTSISQQVFGYV